MGKIVLDIWGFLGSMVKEPVFWGAIMGAGISGFIGYLLSRYNHKKTLERDKIKAIKEAIRQADFLKQEFQDIVESKRSGSAPFNSMYQYGNINKIDPLMENEGLIKELIPLYTKGVTSQNVKDIIPKIEKQIESLKDKIRDY